MKQKLNPTVIVVVLVVVLAVIALIGWKVMGVGGGEREEELPSDVLPDEAAQGMEQMEQELKQAEPGALDPAPKL
ncbi:MAG TPA: hypothetical protein QGH10_00195 [Armatimonadota bacterium]|nr:hypothetical protein [Armatimonadota bacterium]